MSDKIDGWERNEHGWWRGPGDTDAGWFLPHIPEDMSLDVGAQYGRRHIVPLPVLRALLAEHGLSIVGEAEMAVLRAMSGVTEHNLKHWIALHGAVENHVSPPGTPRHLTLDKSKPNPVNPLCALAHAELARRAAQKEKGK